MAIDFPDALIEISSSQRDGELTITVVMWAVSTIEDPKEISPNRLHTELTGQGYTEGSTYGGFGGRDSSNSSLTLSDISIGKLQLTTDAALPKCYRRITLVYDSSTPVISGGLDGFPAWETEEDPVQWEPQITIREVPRTIPRELAVFKGLHLIEDLDGSDNSIDAGDLNNIETTSALFIKGDEIPFMNSAGDLLINPPTETIYDEEITIIKRVPDDRSSVTPSNPDSRRVYRNKTNSFMVKIDLPLQKYDETFAANELLHKLTRRRINSKTWTVGGVEVTSVFWELEYVFLYRPGGWDISVANRGLRRSPVVGDLKPTGESITAGEIASWDLAGSDSGQGPPIAIVDGHRNIPIRQAVPLDLDGSELKENTGDGKKLSAVRYGPFQMNLLDPQLGAPGFTNPLP